MIAKKGNELHKPRCRETYNCIDLIKNEKIKAFVFKIKNAVGYQRKSYEGTDKKYKYNNQFNRQQCNTGQLFFDRLLYPVHCRKFKQNKYPETFLKTVKYFQKI